MPAFFGFQRPDMGYQQSPQKTFCQSSKLLRGEQGVEKVDNMHSYWAESNGTQIQSYWLDQIFKDSRQLLYLRKGFNTKTHFKPEGVIFDKDGTLVMLTSIPQKFWSLVKGVIFAFLAPRVL